MTDGLRIINFKLIFNAHIGLKFNSISKSLALEAEATCPPSQTRHSLGKIIITIKSTLPLHGNQNDDHKFMKM